MKQRTWTAHVFIATSVDGYIADPNGNLLRRDFGRRGQPGEAALVTDWGSACGEDLAHERSVAKASFFTASGSRVASRAHVSLGDERSRRQSSAINRCSAAPTSADASVGKKCPVLGTISLPRALSRTASGTAQAGADRSPASSA